MWEVGCWPHQAGVAPEDQKDQLSLGNDRRTERILMSGSRVRGAVWATGATGVGPLGCLACNTELPCDLIIWGNTTGLKDITCFSHHARPAQ